MDAANRETWDDRQTWSVDYLMHRYGCRAFGPGVFDTQPAPGTELQKIEPYHDLPGGLYPLRDPRGWNETPLWLPEYKTLVFADALTERAGALRVWMSPAHSERALPDLRAMLDLPFERVIQEELPSLSKNTSGPQRRKPNKLNALVLLLVDHRW